MELRQLEYFVAAARTASFTRAAEECHVVPTTVSKSVAALERELGLTLFDRAGSTVVLTGQGRALLADAQGIVRDAALMARKANALSEGRTPHLVVGYYGRGLAENFPAALRLFREETGATVDLRGARTSQDDLIARLREGEIDVLVINREPFGAEMPWTEGEVVALNGFYLVESCGVSVPREGRQSVDLDDVRREGLPLTLFCASNLEAYQAFSDQHIRRDIGLEPGAVARESDMEALMLRVRCGLCRTLRMVPTNVEAFVEDGLVFRRVDGFKGCPTSLIWRRGDGGKLIAALVRASRDAINAREQEGMREGRAHVLAQRAPQRKTNPLSWLFDRN